MYFIKIFNPVHAMVLGMATSIERELESATRHNTSSTFLKLPLICIHQILEYKAGQS